MTRIRRGGRIIIRHASLASAFLVAACGPSGDAPESTRPLSEFAEDVPVVGLVTENVTACDVDAACWLGLELADTAIVALYGLGDRGDPACAIPRAVSDTAFDMRRGDTVEVVVSRCGSEGHFIRRFMGSEEEIDSLAASPSR